MQANNPSPPAGGPIWLHHLNPRPQPFLPVAWVGLIPAGFVTLHLPQGDCIPGLAV